jgi:regulatory protein
VKIGLGDGSFFLFRLAYLLPEAGAFEPETELEAERIDYFVRASRLYALERQALACLARREHSAAELRTKLEKKAASPADITIVLDELRNSGLQSDRRYTEYFIAARLRGHPEGTLALRAKLRQKGIDKEVVAELLGSENENIRQGLERLAIKLYAAEKKRLARKMGTVPVEERLVWASVVKKLMQRGYPYVEIRETLKRVKGFEPFELDDST